MAKKNKRPTEYLIRGTHHLTAAGFYTEDVRSLILRRRLQLMVHSYLYYQLNTNIISDDQWSGWAKELVSLQKEYPDIASRVDYHKDFSNFDGSTGFDLQFCRPEIMRKALQLLNHRKEKSNGPVRHKANRENSGVDAIRLCFP